MSGNLDHLKPVVEERAELRVVCKGGRGMVAMLDSGNSSTVTRVVVGTGADDELCPGDMEPNGARPDVLKP